MKKIVIVLIIIGCVNLSAIDRKTIDLQNEFNGITKLIEYDTGEDPQIYEEIQYYNEEGGIVRIIYKLREEAVEATGIEDQIMNFNEEGTISNYDLRFSEDYFLIHGINRSIEYVDKNDNFQKTEWFVNDRLVDGLSDSQIIESYPFYTLRFLEEEMNINEETTTHIIISGFYQSLRSVVDINNESLPLNDQDREILGYFKIRYQIPNIEDYYQSKTIIEEDGKEFTMYIQKGLEEFIPAGDLTTIRYLLLGYNNNLYLLLTVITDL